MSPFGLPLLTIVQQFCLRTGIPSPLTAVGSQDPQILQIVALLNEEFEEVSTRYTWQALRKEFSFVTIATSDQGDLDTLLGFPVNFIENDVMWNTDTRLPIFGPVGVQRWEQYRALPITGTLIQYRIQGGRLLFYPLDVPVGNTIIGAAAMRYAVADNTGSSPVYKQFFTKDNDVCVFPDALMLASIRWRWKREKGLTYAEDFTRYENIVADQMARDGTGNIVDMAEDSSNFGPGILVPSGSWNVSGGGIPDPSQGGP